MEWCLQRPGGKNDHEIFSSWLSISGEYGERQEVVKKSPERRAEREGVFCNFYLAEIFPQPNENKNRNINSCHM